MNDGVEKILIIDNRNLNTNTCTLDIARYLRDYATVDTVTVDLPGGCPDCIKPLYAAGKVLRLLPRLQRYDTVVSMNIATGLPLMVLQGVLRKRLLPTRHIVVDVGMTRFSAARSLPFRLLLRGLLSTAVAVLCYAESSVRFWKKEVGLRCDVVFLPLPVGAEFIDAAPVAGGSYVFSAGRCGRDYATLIAAMEGSAAPLVIVSDEEHYAKAKSLITGRKGITFYREIAFERYIQLLRGASLVVLPLEQMEYHSGQTVLLQAMACGKPIITTRSNGTVDYVHDGETALLVDTGDQKGLREKIRYFLDHPEAARQMGDNARKKASEEYCERRFSERLYSLVAQRKRA